MQDFYDQTIRVREPASPVKGVLFRLSHLELGFLTANNNLMDWLAWW